MKKESGKKRRPLPPLLLGVFLGAGLTYALVQWRKASLPCAQLQVLESQRLEPGLDGLSIYEVDGDVTRDWPAPSGGPDASQALRALGV